jgi:hypothetical protein
MLSLCVSCLALCVTATQDAKLEISAPRPTYGHLGALRPVGVGVLPGDIVHFMFEVRNLKLDDTGKASYSIAIEIRDEAGKLFFEQKPHNSVAQNFFGGASLPCSAHLEIPLDAKAGSMAWKITVTDRSTKQVAFVSGKGRILPADFGLIHLGLFADAETQTPMSAVGVVGDSAYLHFAVVGFGRDKDLKHPNVQVSMRILDERGTPTLAKAITGQVQAGIPANAQIVPLQFGMILNRAGRFTVELTAEDRTSGKSSRVTYLLRVLPAE